MVIDLKSVLLTGILELYSNNIRFRVIVPNRSRESEFCHNGMKPFNNRITILLGFR